MREKTKLNATKDVSKQKSLFRIWIGFFVKYIGILIVAGVVGILLLTFAYHIPVNQESKDSTFEYSEQMGWAPLVNNRYTQYIPFFTSYEIGTLDDATDRTILNNCYNEGEESAIKRAADMNDYGRYWHGYVAILRPIFYFMDYWDYLLVNSFAQLFVMGCVGYAIYKATGQKRYLLAFFCSCAFLTPAATAMSLQNSPVFYVAMLGSLFVLLKTDWILEKNRRYYLFLFLGIVTCYFDFLTYPLLSFAFPFCWLLVAAGEKVNLKERITLLFGGGISYVIGWGGFFGVKWVVETIVCGPSILDNGIGAVFNHLFSGMPDENRLLHQTYCRIDTLYNNFRHYLFPLFILILLAWIVVLICKFLRGGFRIKTEQLIFAAVTLTSPAWYLIMNTHTSYHHLFTYRVYGASLLGFMLFVCGCLDKSSEESIEGKAKIAVGDLVKRAAVLICCLAVGLGASRLAMEDRMDINGGDNEEFPLAQGDTLEFEFTPVVNNVKGFTFCVKPNGSTDGDLVIGVYDGETLCGEEITPIETYEDTVFEMQLTDWKLTAGKTYQMKVAVRDNAAGVILLVTPEGEKPQAEYGRAYLNGEQLPDIAPLSGITYRGHFQSVQIKLYLSVCVAAFLLMWFMVADTLLKNKYAGCIKESKPL